MNKYGYSADTKLFEIDPRHLAEGLAAARAAGHTAVRIRALDNNDSGVTLDVAMLSEANWLTGLTIHPDLKPVKKADFKKLEKLSKLEVLKVFAHAALDFACFPLLQDLVLTGASDLQGLDKLAGLRVLALMQWKGASLPDSLRQVRVDEVVIANARKLESIDALCANQHIKSLKVQIAPALHIGAAINGMGALESLHLEKIKDADVGRWKLGALRYLFATQLPSLKFIAHLPKLQELFFWELDDGDMSPALAHPTLHDVSFSKDKKHYTHTLDALREQLLARQR